MPPHEQDPPVLLLAQAVSIKETSLMIDADDVTDHTTQDPQTRSSLTHQDSKIIE